MAGTTAETRTRTTVIVEEYQVYACPSCGQFCEDEELVPVVLNADVETVERAGADLLGDAREQVLCRYCTESIFDYDPEESMPIRARPERVERVERAAPTCISSTSSAAASPGAKRFAANIAPTLIALSTAAIVVFVGLEMTQTAVETIQAADEPVRLDGTTMGSPVDLLALVPITMIVVALIILISVLGRR